MLQLDYGQALVSEWEERALKIAAELFDKDGKTAQPFAESIQPLGLLARPKDPDPDGEGGFLGAGFVYGTIGDELFGWPTTDTRILDKIPELPPGSTVLYASNGAMLYLDGESGNVILLVPYEVGGTAKAHALTFDIENKSIQLRHGAGMGLSITEGGKNSIVINNKAGDAYLEINDDGMVLNAASVKVNGGMIAGNIASAEGVILNNQFQAWKAMVDAALNTLAGAAGSMVPAITPSASAQVVASTMLKGSPA